VLTSRESSSTVPRSPNPSSPPMCSNTAMLDAAPVFGGTCGAERDRFLSSCDTDESTARCAGRSGFTEQTRMPEHPYGGARHRAISLSCGVPYAKLPVLTTNCSNNYGPFNFGKMSPHHRNAARASRCRSMGRGERPGCGLSRITAVRSGRSVQRQAGGRLLYGGAAEMMNIEGDTICASRQLRPTRRAHAGSKPSLPTTRTRSALRRLTSPG
jgi:hypothetical protein